MNFRFNWLLIIIKWKLFLGFFFDIFKWTILFILSIIYLNFRFNWKWRFLFDYFFLRTFISLQVKIIFGGKIIFLNFRGGFIKLLIMKWSFFFDYFFAWTFFCLKVNISGLSRLMIKIILLNFWFDGGLLIFMQWRFFF